MEPNKRKRTTVWILVSIVFAACVYGGVRWWMSDRVEKILQEYATSLNVYCPRDMEAGMSLKRVVVLPDRTLVYNIVSEVLTREVLQQNGQFDLEWFTQQAREKMIETLRSDPNLPLIRRLGITFVYSYKNEDGSPFMEFTLTPEDYR